MICCCFLICGHFYAMTVWSQWLAKCRARFPERAVGVVVHASNCTESDYAGVRSWCHQWSGSLVETIPTAWGSINIVKAEGLLFDTAKDKYPSASHFWLVSEKTVPIVSPERLFDTIASGWRLKTLYTPLKKVPMHTDITQYISDRNWTPKAGGQFLLLNANHWSLVRDDFLRWWPFIETVIWETYIEGGGYTPDEVIIQTLLYNLCPRKELHQHVVVADKFTTDRQGRVLSPRASIVSLTDISSRIKENHWERHPKALAVRKVTVVTPALLRLLQTENIV
jgi:hypothetical protein